MIKKVLKSVQISRLTLKGFSPIFLSSFLYFFHQGVFAQGRFESEATNLVKRIHDFILGPFGITLAVIGLVAVVVQGHMRNNLATAIVKYAVVIFLIFGGAMFVQYITGKG